MRATSSTLITILAFGTSFVPRTDMLLAAEYSPPKSVSVLPVFLVPKGQSGPTDDQKAKLMKHLRWAERRYKEMLRGRGTFALADKTPRVVRLDRPLSFYRQLAKGESAGYWLVDLMQDLKTNRYTCPYVFCAVIMNSRNRYPVGGGRPINGGINTGGGILVISSYALDRIPNFQSTLQHEIGHAFGLPHVDVYRYNMKTNASIMSYNPNHKTNKFQPARRPGKLIPEDVRALALNDRVFPKLTFDARKDMPPRYRLGKIVPLGPMKLPGSANLAIEVATSSAEHFRSSAGNIVQSRIRPSRGPGIKVDPKTMWISGKAPNSWVSATIKFPAAVELTRILVYSQHSGRYNMASGVEVSVEEGGRFRDIASRKIRKANDEVSFEATKARTWRLRFRTGTKPKVCIRGLRFFSDAEEVFPPLVPNEG